MKTCRVSYEDANGIWHAVDVDSDSLYEAVGLAIVRFQRNEHVPYDPPPMTEFVIEPREPAIQHRLSRKRFDEWFARPGGSPREVATRGRIRDAMNK